MMEKRARLSKEVGDFEEDESEGGKNKEKGACEDKNTGSLGDQRPRSSDKAKAHRGKKRLAGELDEGENLYHVPAFKPAHDTWANLETYLQKYMTSTHQKLVIKEVVHVARRNADLRAQVRYQGIPDTEIPLPPPP
ncbi:hypothetical protein L916_09576, partial [Phytophthora nicotianae]